MCGFSGKVHFSGSHLTLELLETMGALLARRGPDEQKVIIENDISLVFRRLAIVDVEGGSQPIWNKEQSIMVMVNGEIYNHVDLRYEHCPDELFTTQSDAEIVLHLYQHYGLNAIDYLNGMFAMVIWDLNNGQIHLIRDRIGIKPLYYYCHDDGGLSFSSELKALLVDTKIKPALNWQDLTVPTVQETSPVATYLKGIQHIPAGGYLTIENKGFSHGYYWQMEEHMKVVVSNQKQTQQTMIDSYDNLLRKSVKRRLMSDVPIGLFLSGGIDSSLLAGILASENHKTHCFSFVDPITVRSGDVAVAQQVAEELGHPFHPFLLDHQLFIENFTLLEFERMIALIESPRFDLEWLFKSLLHKAAKETIPDLKVMLLGQGADEFCGGYSKYLGTPWSCWQDYINGEVKPSLNDSNEFSNSIPKRFSGMIQRNMYPKKGLSDYHRKMLTMQYQLQHFNLWHEDRSSAFYGIESRVPFLDHELVEFLVSLPASSHESLFWNKELLRAVADRYIPNYPKKHLKVPFFITDEVSILDSLIVSLCNKVYPAFKQIYLSCGNRSHIINKEQFEQWYEQLQQPSIIASHSAWRLIEAMSIQVFNVFCVNTSSFMSRILENETSLFLQPIKPNKLSEVIRSCQPMKSYLNQKEPSVETYIKTSKRYTIVNPLSEPTGDSTLHLLDNGMTIQTIQVPPQFDWSIMFLEALGEESLPTKIGYWCDRIQRPANELLPIIKNFITTGFIEIL